MDLSPLNKAIPSWGSPTLEGFDLQGAQEGQRIKGSNRQFVRFYHKTYAEVYATKVKINENTGTTTVLATDTRPKTVEMVQIITPGDKNEVDDVACDFHRREHWAQYKAFRDGKTAPLGTSLDDCGFVNPNVATELRYHGCHTVEQLADCSDALCNIIPNGWDLREFARAKCKAALDSKGNEQVNVLKIELEKSRAVQAEMQKQLNEMKGLLYSAKGEVVSAPALEEEKPTKKLGRPRKIETNITEMVTE